MPRPLSRVRYGSLLSYTPHGGSATAHSSKTVCHTVKKDGYVPNEHGIQEGAIAFAVRRLTEAMEDFDGFEEFLGPDALLVPAPKSAVFDKDALWVPQRICSELEHVNLGAETRQLLVRHTAVPKSAWSKTSERTTVEEHIASMRVDKQVMEPPAFITVVDDVITRGAMMVATITLLREAYPKARIGGFALVRFQCSWDFERILDPHIGFVDFSPRGPRRS